MVASSGHTRVRALHVCVSQRVLMCRRVDAEWMCSKRDRQEAKRKAKEATVGRKPTTTSSKVFGNGAASNGDAGSSAAEVGDDAEDVYEGEMDSLKCILYFHGGANAAYDYVADTCA